MASEENEITEAIEKVILLSQESETGSRPLSAPIAIPEKYSLGKLIGSGSYGDVYEARHLTLDQVMALKVMQQSAVSQVTLKRFKQEAQVISSLNHPNIVRVFDYDVTKDHRPFLAMERLEGRSLSEMLQQDGPLSPAKAIDIFVQACKGMAYAHDHNVLHRDLKPSNLILANENSQQVVKVIDFGIAKRTDEERSHRQDLTRTGEIVGTAYYMSPEQCTDNVLDARSDIYSLGCTLYEALSGQPPFPGNNAFETLSMHLQAAPPKLHSLNGSVKDMAALESVVLKAMAKEPDDRYQSMAEMQQALVAAGEANDTLFSILQTNWQRRTNAGRKKGVPMQLILTGLVLCLLVAQSVSLVRQTMEQPVGQDAEAKWKDYNRTGQRQMHAGDYRAAERPFRQAIQLSGSFSHDKDDAIWRDRHLMALEKLALALNLDGRATEEAKITAELHEQRREKRAEATTRDKLLLDLWNAYPSGAAQVDAKRFADTANQLVDLCHRYTDQRKFKEANAILSQMLQKSKAVLGKDSYTVASILHEQGRLFNRLHKYPEATKVLEDSLAIRTKHFPENTLDIGKSWYNISVAKLKSHDAKSATTALQNATEIFQKHNFVEGLAYGAELRGLILGELGEHNKAITSFEESLQLMQNNGDYQGLRDCVDQICYILSQQNPDKREKFLTDQLNALTNGRNADADRAFYNERLATLHEQRGNLQLAAKEYATALSIDQLNSAPSDPEVLALLKACIRVEDKLGETKLAGRLGEELLQSSRLSEKQTIPE